jgi:hypothetical protein
LQTVAVWQVRRLLCLIPLRQKCSCSFSVGEQEVFIPTINPNMDNWSRRPSVVQKQAFANWAANGERTSQTFQFVADRNLSYISLSIAGMNHKNASYVAFDVE